MADAQPAITVRRATLADVGAMHGVIDVFAKRNDILPRERGSLISALRDFHIVEVDGRIAGCAALAIIDDDLAEVRTLVVDDSAQGLGLGRRLVEACIEDARQMGFHRVFALTRVDGFFERLGFRRPPMGALPQKVWLDCAHCPSFPDCDEIAVIREV
jgi:amino-acid N-acetyltransferase